VNAHQLRLDDGKPAGAWYCEDCKTVHGNEALAEMCCTCNYCGKYIKREKGRGRSSSHSACFHAEVNRRYDEQLAKATEVGSEYSGWVYCERGGPRDGYAEDVDTMAEWWADQIADGELELDKYPEFVLACKPEPPGRIDLSDLLDRICEEGYEDQRDDIEVPDGLRELLDKFNDMNAHLVSWMIDHTRKVKMPPAPKERHQEELTGSEIDLAADLNNPHEGNP
jgi:hypothetical protein